MPSISLTAPPAPPSSTGSTNSPFPSLLHTPSGLAVVEIQGSVLGEQRDASDRPNEPLQLGNFIFPAAEGQHQNSGWDGKRVFLFIEKHQRLAGEVKKLSKPLAVIRRKPAQDSVVRAVDEVEMVEIVYHKLLFAHRPEPVGASAVQKAFGESTSDEQPVA